MMMISKTTLKYVNSLQLKKNRQEEGLFLVEGAKSVLELLDSDFEIVSLFLADTFSHKNSSVLKKHEYQVASEAELSKMSSFENNNAGLAVVKKKENQLLNQFQAPTLVLDGIKDPGNLGTIIRIADWYGFNQIVCSADCVEFYNPKVISATMGSFCRVNIFYTDISVFLSDKKQAVYGAFLGGDNIHETNFEPNGIIIIGNESFGISDEIEKKITQKITIPRFGNAESLNAGIATGIFLDNFRRIIPKD